MENGGGLQIISYIIAKEYAKPLVASWLKVRYMCIFLRATSSWARQKVICALRKCTWQRSVFCVLRRQQWAVPAISGRSNVSRLSCFLSVKSDSADGSQGTYRVAFPAKILLRKLNSTKCILCLLHHYCWASQQAVLNCSCIYKWALGQWNINSPVSFAMLATKSMLNYSHACQCLVTVPKEILISSIPLLSSLTKSKSKIKLSSSQSL